MGRKKQSIRRDVTIALRVEALVAEAVDWEMAKRGIPTRSALGRMALLAFFSVENPFYKMVEGSNAQANGVTSGRGPEREPETMGRGEAADGDELAPVQG